MSSGSHVEGFLLLTLPNCTLTTPSGSQTGHLALQCVTLDISSEYQADRDVWLVLKLNSFEMIISPTQRINYSRSMHSYVFLPEVESSGLVQLTASPDPSNPASFQDLETMEVILSQYGILYDVEGPNLDTQSKPEADREKKGYNLEPPTGTSDLKGRLVLVDEHDGEIVATLDDGVPIKEDKALTAEGHEKDPVVIELPGEAAGRIEAYAHPPSGEERDMLMQTAGLISRGIVLATSAITTGLNSASNYYISHSTPTSRPIVFSPRTRTNIRRIHKVSGTAVAVTSKTTGAILKTIDYVANRIAGSDPRMSPGHGRGIGSQLAPPPLPPRGGSPVHLPPATRPPGGAPPLPPRNPRLLNRLLASTDLLLTTLEQSSEKVVETGTDAVSASLAHKYGQDAGEASRIAGQSVRNVGLVYIDVRGIARRALLKKAGLAVVKARMGGRDVILGPQGQAMRGRDLDLHAGQYPYSSPPAGAPKVL
ncbi:senescence-associated protein-domain-containing protein [Gautieria morchelliformis]|nr:senescence-associated protein-domain-containing protein [Gautieria morchelliformis]